MIDFITKMNTVDIVLAMELLKDKFESYDITNLDSYYLAMIVIQQELNNRKEIDLVKQLDLYNLVLKQIIKNN